MKKKIFYISSNKNDLNYCHILPIYNSNFIIPRSLIIYNDISKCKKSDVISIKISTKFLMQVSMCEFVVLKNIKIKCKDVCVIHKYYSNLKKHKEYTLDEFRDKEIERIKENINRNMSSIEHDFYENIFSGKVSEIVLYRTIGKEEYEKLLNNKTIHGRLQESCSSNVGDMNGL